MIPLKLILAPVAGRQLGGHPGGLHHQALPRRQPDWQALLHLEGQAERSSEK